MNTLICATCVTLWLYLVETFFEYMKLITRRKWDDYIILFLIILSSCYVGKTYGREVNLRNPVINEETTFLVQYSEYYEVIFETHHDMSCKFVPPGTPAKYVNEDGTPSEAVWKTIRKCNQQIARESLRLHQEKCQEFFWEADRLTIYLPETSNSHTIRTLFTTMMATVPASGCSKLCVAVAAFITQYGLDVYDEYERVMFNLNMCKWHYNCANMFKQYIEEKGW